MNRKRKTPPVLLKLSDEISEVPKCTVIDSPNFVLGRSQGVNLQLLFSTVSKNHCFFVYDENNDKWSIISNTKRSIIVDEKTLKKHDSSIVECGTKVKIAPITFEFKCSSDGQCKCRVDLKKAKFSNSLVTDIENVIIIDDDDDDEVVTGSHSQLPDSSSDDIYLNPVPSCSGVSLPPSKANSSPLSIEELEKELENYFKIYDSSVSFKEELNAKLNYVKNLAKFNSTSELYFSDPSENYSLNSSINDLSTFFEEEFSKLSVKTACKSDDPITKIVSNLDSLLMEKTKHAMGFLHKFLEPAFYRSSVSPIQSKQKPKDVESNSLKEKILKLQKENEELRNQLFNYDEDKRNKDVLEQTISNLQEQINTLSFDNSTLLGQICSTSDEISQVKEKCDSLEKKVAHQSTVVTYQPPVVTYQPPVATYQPPVATYHPPVATYQPPVATYQPPGVAYQNPVVTYANPMAVYPNPAVVASTSAAATSAFGGGMKNTLSTMPFEILKFMFKACPATSEDGLMMRRCMLSTGVIEMVLRCIAIYAHQTETIDSANSTKNELIANCLKIVRDSCGSTPTAVVAPSTGKKPKKTTVKSSFQYWAKGTGYGTGDTSQSLDAQRAMLRKKTEEEMIIVLLLVLASYINPEPLLHANFDIILIGELNFEEEKPPLPIEFVNLIENSCLLPVLSSYLTNDSVLDMGRHIPLYRAVMVLLRVLAFNSMTVKFFLPSDCLAGTSSSSSRVISLAEPLEKMRASVETYSATLLNTKPATATDLTSDKEDEDINSLIADIIATHKIVEMNSQKIISKTVTTMPQNSSMASAEEVYLRVMKKLQYDTYDMIVEGDYGNDIKFTVSHHFEQRIRTDGERSLPARVKRLAQEAVTLSNSLPLSYSSSVFVRRDSDRMDVMKVLIIGPAETPYANGCFEFDVYFPPNYPNGPMLINLETTGRRSVRFNPNLYNEGKVCLSILNTWNGRPEEKWNAQTSSFLQVLVSIQSLILVPDPYFNEPGYERSRGTAAGNRSSREYNANIRQATVQWAMLDQLRNPSPCFQTIIRNHFFLKRDEIVGQITQWMTEGNSSTMRGHVQAMKEELVKLELLLDQGQTSFT